jgi:uncharacterized membrane protein YjjP (DUF1212 family)
METPEGEIMTRMRRIGYHGNDLDGVECFNAMSRAICNRRPSIDEARSWFEQSHLIRRTYSLPVYLLGNAVGAFGFALFFGGNHIDGLLSAICGFVIGLMSRFMGTVKTNPFFKTIASSFVMSLIAYSMAGLGLTNNVDAVIIGALMILVPGLLFTNALRDIIYGDTNSGVNRIVQVFLIAVAIALGTAAAWSGIAMFFGAPNAVAAIDHPIHAQLIACYIGCIGFVILFNIHGPGGLLCALGGTIAWGTYLLVFRLTRNDLAAYFWAAMVASLYSETMARIRKYPAISYLVISIFPLIPGASVYYTMNYAVRDEMVAFADKGMHTIAIAGVIAVGVILISTLFRMWTIWKRRRK